MFKTIVKFKVTEIIPFNKWYVQPGVLNIYITAVHNMGSQTGSGLNPLVEQGHNCVVLFHFIIQTR